MCWSAVGVIMEQASRVSSLDGVFTIETNIYIVDLVFILLLLFLFCCYLILVITVFRLVFVCFWVILRSCSVFFHFQYSEFWPM